MVKIDLYRVAGVFVILLLVLFLLNSKSDYRILKREYEKHVDTLGFDISSYKKQVEAKDAFIASVMEKYDSLELAHANTPIEVVYKEIGGYMEVKDDTYKFDSAQVREMGLRELQRIECLEIEIALVDKMDVLQLGLSDCANRNDMLQAALVDSEKILKKERRRKTAWKITAALAASVAVIGSL